MIKRNWSGIIILAALAVDLLLAAASAQLAWTLFFDVLRPNHPVTRASYSLLWITPAIYLLTMMILGAETKLLKRPLSEQVLAFIKAAVYGLMITGIWVFISKGYVLSRGFIMVFYGLAPIVVTLGRVPVNALNLAVIKAGWGKRRALIVGGGENDRQLFDQLAGHHALGYEIAGFLVEGGQDLAFSYGGVRAVGLRRDLERVARELAVDQVFISDLPPDHMDVYRTCREQQIGLNAVSDQIDLLLRAARIPDASGVAVIRRQGGLLLRAGWRGKQLFDRAASALGIAAVGPLLGLLALLIKLDSRGPALFRQRRIGRNGVPFVMYKFRTMAEGSEDRQQDLAGHNESDGPIFKIRRDPRITRLGWWLRRFSIDELPQLINVLRGEMSLVGPRPPLESEVRQYQDWHRSRLEGPLGMTGLWQVSGRSKLRFDEMVLLDLYYLNNWTPLLDLRIILKSIPAVILGKGAY